MLKGRAEESEEKGVDEVPVQEDGNAAGPEATPDSNTDTAANAGTKPGGDPTVDVEQLFEERRALEEKASAAEEALRAERERALRLQADFENFRRRARQEQAELSNRALDPFIKELLPVLDNLDRAVDAAESSGATSSDALLQGVKMVQKQLVELLAARDVKAMVTVGESFDPHLHEAVQRVDEGGYARDTVTEEWQKGYVREGRVLRPAMVKVAVGTGEGGGAQGASDGS